MIHFYVDTSGAKGSPVMVAGGYLARQPQWERFEDEWSRALRAARVTAFHATDFYNFKGEFEGWDQDVRKHNRFAQRFTAIAESKTEIGVVMGMDVPAFDTHLAKLFKGIPDTPHRRVTPLMFCTGVLLTRVAKHYVPKGEQIAVVFEWEDGIGEVIEYFNMAKRAGEPWTKAYATVGTGDKSLLPLQAADLVAHESWRRLKEHIKPTGRDLRKSLRRLLRREALEIRIVSEANMKADLSRFQHYLDEKSN